MYESWYGFREKPFSLTPDPKYLYLSPRHAEAFAHLEFGRRERGGFIVITGEVGTGKTTLARYFLSKLGPDTRTAVVLYPALTAAELLRTTLDDLHVEATGDSLKSLVDALHRFLLESRAAGRDVVLLIDEAQDLSAEVLEQIRLISNLETDTEKLIQIILMGQSELRDLLARHDLRQLAQRVTARYHLGPLDLAETAEYVRHRLGVAGGEGKVGFTHEALATAHRRSGGVPRLVNLICDRALLAGYVNGSRTITAKLVDQAAGEVQPPPSRPVLHWRHGLVATGLALGLALLAFAFLPRMARAPEGGASPAGGSTPAEATSTPPWGRPPSPVAPPLRPSAALDVFLRSAGRAASLAASQSRLARAWDGQALSRAPLRTHLEQLRALDLPATLEVFHPSRSDTAFLTLVGLGADHALVSLGPGPDETVPLSQMEAFWTREAILYWPETRIARDTAGLMAWAQERLAASGYVERPLEEAVRRFQREAGLVSDGRLGPRTRMTLFARAGEAHPRLSSAVTP